MNHAEASELLGAYALDAVEPAEAAALEAHLETCPRCRDELSNHREVVGLLAYTGQEAPEGLWDRVVARINDPGEADMLAAPRPPGPLSSVSPGTRPEPPRLGRPEAPGAPGLPGAPGGFGVPGDSGVSGDPGGFPVGAGPGGRRVGARAGRWQTGRWRPARRLSALAAAAAVIVVALLGVEVGRLQSRTDHLQGQISAMAGQPTMAVVRSALAVPGARKVVLQPVGGGAPRLDAVILPGGQGYLYDSALAPLSPAHTYQLWGVVGQQRISYGVLGGTPASVVAFRASVGVQALAVTAEVAGGVVSSTHQPVALGLVR